jgi:hypothetical protein
MQVRISSSGYVEFYHSLCPFACVCLSSDIDDTTSRQVAGDPTDLPIPNDCLRRQVASDLLRFTNNPIAKKAHVGDLNVLLYHASEVQFVDCMRLARNVICAAY